MREFWNDKAYGVAEGLDWPVLRYLQNLTRGLDLSRVRVLELGCGIRNVAAELHKRGATVMAVDFSGEMISRARDLHGEPPGLRFVEGDICSLALEQRFDLICVIAVLHEIDLLQYGSLLAVLDKHLASGGCAYFLENSYFNPLFRVFHEHFVGRYRIPKYGSSHETPFDKARWHLIQGHFTYCKRTGEIFCLFGRIDAYVLKSRWPRVRRLCQGLGQRVSDSDDGDQLKALLSYYQTVYFSHTRPSLAT
jgi:SAM-dependent methyltransferase